MAHYGRDYDREFDRGFGGRGFGGRRSGPSFGGGMRSDGWGGNEDWQDFAGEEGWFGGYGGGSRDRNYDADHRDRGGRRNEGGLFGDRQGRDFGESRGYGGDFRRRGGFGRSQEGYRGDSGYSEGWDDGHGRQSGSGLFGQSRGQYRAADIMTENPHTVTPETTISDVARQMRDLDVGIIPVVDSEDSRRLRGVITDRDIAVRAIAEGKSGNAKVSDCMTERVRHVNKNDSIHDVMRVMRQEQVRRVPVTDREGRLVGIIAQADLAVDYASNDNERNSEVGEVLEHVSEPARPRREGNRMAAGSARAGQQTEEG